MIRNKGIAGIALALLSLLARPAHATAMMALTGPELAALSDVVAHVRVIKVGGHVTKQPMRVFTDAEIEVIDGLKGSASGTRLQVSFPGGVSHGLGMQIDGQIGLKEGTECVIYLMKRSASTEQTPSFMPTAMRQGYYEIQTRPYDGVRVARRTTDGLLLLRRTKVAPTALSSNQRMREFNTPLVQLLEDIRQDVSDAKVMTREQVLGLAR